MFKLAFRTDNAAFEGDARDEVARILRKLADTVWDAPIPTGNVVDGNGNVVGTWTLTGHNS